MAKTMKAKINKQNYIKLKSFFTAKVMQDIIRKRQPSEGEKISVHNASDKVLISKIYKTLTKLINNKKNPTAPHK